jgi:ABC-type nickel/cobalt efflux system permease component RcnA
VPRSSHDRTVAVYVGCALDEGRLTVHVAYRLEVDELTVILEDMVPFADEVDFSKFKKDNKVLDFYGEFTRLYAPVFAKNLQASLDGKPIAFTCVKRAHTLKDEEGRHLGHLRCDFQFQASIPFEPGRPNRLKFREGNYELQNGLIDVALTGDGPVRLRDVVAPSPELKKRAATDRQPGDEERLRTVSATLRFQAEWVPPPLPEKAPSPTVAQPPPQTRTDNPSPTPPRADNAPHDEGLLRLWLHSGFSLWLLLLAAGLGAAHALTPGHGKTLVAAYLVGENGTTWHAVVLGLVTTLTHTSVVLVTGVALFLVYGRRLPEDVSASVQTGLQLIMGLLVVSMGVWLLLRRLSGRADHVHLGGGHHHHHHGGHHHHHHGHADHDHDGEGRVIPRKPPVGWWGLVVLGITGGLVPCVEAIAILLVTIGTGEIWLALAVVLAFSAGLAAVLVLIGILVVHAKGFAGSRWGEGRFVRALPTLSAVVVTLLGLWLCYDSVHNRPRAPDGGAAAVTQP